MRWNFFFLLQGCSPRRHSSSSQRHPQFLGRYSPSRNTESSVEHYLRTESNSDFYGIDPRERRRLPDRLGSPASLSDVDRQGFLTINISESRIYFPPANYVKNKKIVDTEDIFKNRIELDLRYMYVLDLDFQLSYFDFRFVTAANRYQEHFTLGKVIIQVQ